MNINYFLNNEEKIIFKSFFLKEESEGKSFRAWTDNFLSKYDLKIEKNQDKYSDKYHFNLMWDKDTHLLQYILKQDLSLVTTRLRYILKLNSHLDKTDNDGNNLLHLSAQKKSHHWLLNFFCTHHNYDIYQINKDGHTYHTLFVNNFDKDALLKIPKKNSDDFVYLIQDNHFLFQIIKQFNEKDIKEHINEVTYKNFIQNCDTILNNFYTFQNKINSSDLGLVKDCYLEDIQNLEKTLTYIKLSKDLKENKALKLPKI